MRDPDLYEALQKHTGLAKPPVIWKERDVIDRAKTLNFPCYDGFQFPTEKEAA
jgi:hypothetical protein